jgi:fumarylacetoacetate (FAA) hydrolase
MKLVSWTEAKRERLGFIFHGRVYRCRALDARLPDRMHGLLQEWDHFLTILKEAEASLIRFPALQATGYSIDDLALNAPTPRPVSIRDGYVFHQHVAAARNNRGMEMFPEFREYPVFYFGNRHAVFGPGEISCMRDHFNKLDFELKAAVVISRKGRNIRAVDAEKYMAGLMIMNDFSARMLQVDRMMPDSAPAKEKDFATAFGPVLVTLDELKAFEVAPKKNHKGKSWNLTMTASLNGRQISSENLSDMDWTFAELIEHASYGVDLYAGDVIGSGTIGAGCLQEINDVAKSYDPGYKEIWLQPGDEVSLRITGLDELKNRIVQAPGDYSILGRKS